VNYSWILSVNSLRNVIVVVREPKTAPLAAEDRQQAVSAIAVMIGQWWSGGQGRNADVVRRPDPPDDAAATDRR